MVFPYLALPREIRDEIYKHLLCFEDGIHIVEVSGLPERPQTASSIQNSIQLCHERGLPIHNFKAKELICFAIFLTTRQISAEALDIFYKFNHFSIRAMDTAAFDSFIALLPPKRRCQIQSLELIFYRTLFKASRFTLPVGQLSSFIFSEMEQLRTLVLTAGFYEERISDSSHPLHQIYLQVSGDLAAWVNLCKGLESDDAQFLDEAVLPKVVQPNIGVHPWLEINGPSCDELAFYDHQGHVKRCRSKSGAGCVYRTIVGDMIFGLTKLVLPAEVGDGRNGVVVR